MKDTTQKFLNLFFEVGEKICVSPDEFAYLSIDQEEIKNNDIKLVSNKLEVTKNIKEEDINLVAINPINGPRNDANVTSFRSFLVELDEGGLPEQLKYIENSGLPYSTCIFSGNKSLHFGVVLDKPCAGIASWKILNKWILNILEKADQQTLNPSRCIRFPGNYRKNGKKLLQAPHTIGKRVKREDLDVWLNKHPDKKPKPVIKKTNPNMVYSCNKIKKIPKWIKEYAENGIHDERNKTWFNIACWYSENGFDIDWFYRFWENIFEEEVDFSRKEWENTIKSAYKRIQGL